MRHVIEPVDERSAPSATEATFRRLRADILAGQLQPGKKLKIAELQQRLQVSQAAIRESLSRLTSEGLVDAAPQRGFFVAPISEALLKDMYAARIDIESVVLTRSILNGDAVWEGNLVGAHHRLLRTPEPVGGPDDLRTETWFHNHNHFHYALVAACEVKSLLRIRQQLFEQTERYRRLSKRVDRGNRDTKGEHQALCDAAVERDVAGCVKLMREHLQRTADIVCASLSVGVKAPVPPKNTKMKSARRHSSAATTTVSTLHQAKRARQ